MSFKPSTQLIRKIAVLTVFSSILTMLSLPLTAATGSDTRSSKSISFSNDEVLDIAAKDERLKQAEADVKTAIVRQGYRVESLAALVSTESVSYSNSAEIILYDASAELISDFNADGFYHRFSVSIDADTVYDISYIYAKLYLSYEGGAWNHYATSDDYHIYGDSELDNFTIETELADGFPPGYYDVRIELYDADTGEWLLSYGPYNDASLSTLPLEDAYFDDSYRTALYPVETDVVVAGYGHGSMSWWLLISPALLIITRRLLIRAG